MNGLKRFIRPGYVISVVCHAVALAVVLLFAGAHAFAPATPDAMMAEIVPADQVPQFDVLPALPGSELPGANDANATPQAPSVEPAAQPPQQPPASPQRDANTAIPQPQPAPLEPTSPQPMVPDNSAQQVAATPPSEPQERSNERWAPEAAGVAGMFAMPLTLPNGRIGDNFDELGTEVPKLAHDIAAFRAQVRSCATLPAGLSPDEKFTIVLGVSFKPNGSLAELPELSGGGGELSPSSVPQFHALVRNTIAAVQKCQPYKMFPADKYKEWKSLNVPFTPQDFAAR